jgi:hypothetical protein
MKKITEEQLTEISAQICDIFEDVLEENDVTIPDDERDDNQEDQARLFGATYYEVEDKVKEILRKLGE